MKKQTTENENNADVLLLFGSFFGSDGEDADGTDDEEKRERVLGKIVVPKELDSRMKNNLFFMKQVGLGFNQSSVLPVTTQA